MQSKISLLESAPETGTVLAQVLHGIRVLIRAAKKALGFPYATYNRVSVSIAS
jgi:hypothetical protein